jgi:oligosaccharide translocation protein RFT1
MSWGGLCDSLVRLLVEFSNNFEGLSVRMVPAIFSLDAGSQLGARLLTFVLNVLAARLLSPEEYGISAVQFHLINSSIVFLSREGVRRSCLRVSQGCGKEKKDVEDRIVSGSLMVIPAGVVITLLGAMFLMWKGFDPVYTHAAVMQCVAALIEIVSDPFYILATSRMWFGMRTGCEAFASIVKNFVSVWLLATMSPKMDPTLAMSWGQLAYSISLLFCFSISFLIFDGRCLVVPKHFVLDVSFFPLYGAFSLQALGKLVLAEGSKAVLAIVTSPAVQGVYGLVNNLGSLVVRTLFQPYEEIVFVSFSTQEKATNVAALEHQATLLSRLTQVVCIIGGLSACFGPSYSYVALRILYGEAWASSEAPAALGLYSIYVALLAMNGTLEAFLHGVADRTSLFHNNIVLIVTSLLHMGLSVLSVRTYGARGLLVADSANMILRILYCCWYMKSYFKTIGGLKRVRLLPSMPILLLLGFSFVCSKVSQAVWLPETLHGRYQETLMNVWDPYKFGTWDLSTRIMGHVSVGIVLLCALFATIAVSMDIKGAVSDIRSTRAKEKIQ